MENKCSCETGGKTVLIFACSGAADVGELSDRVGRRLGKEGCGKMYCLAGLGGDVSGIVASTREASKILMIDGCPVDCGRKTLQRSGFKDFAYLRITDLGFTKGKCPINEESIQKVSEEGVKLLAC